MLNRAQNAMDFGPKFINAFQGEPGGRCEKRFEERFPLAEGEETMVLRPSALFNRKSLPVF